MWRVAEHYEIGNWPYIIRDSDGKAVAQAMTAEVADLIAQGVNFWLARERLRLAGEAEQEPCSARKREKRCAQCDSRYCDGDGFCYLQKRDI